MTIRVATEGRNAALTAITSLANGGSIKVYTGSQPATANTAASGTLLATFTLPSPAFETASAGSQDIDANPDLTATAAATGTAGWARVYKADGTSAVFDGSVGTSGADFLIVSTSITSGQTVNLLSGALSFPA